MHNTSVIFNFNISLIILDQNFFSFDRDNLFWIFFCVSEIVLFCFVFFLFYFFWIFFCLLPNIIANSRYYSCGNISLISRLLAFNALAITGNYGRFLRSLFMPGNSWGLPAKSFKCPAISLIPLITLTV